MKGSKFFIILCLLIAALSIGCVFAADDGADINGTQVMQSNDGGSVVDSEPSVDELGVSNEDVLNAGDEDFTSLQTLINANDDIYLEHNYTYSSSDEGNFNAHGAVVIDKDMTIDGKGHTIDAKGQMGIFYLTSGCKSLTLRNLTLMNAHSGNDGGAICSDSYGVVFNFHDVNFINNSANSRGGAIYIKNEYGEIDVTLNSHNVNFINNTAGSTGGKDSCGGVVHLSSERNTVNLIMNCYDTTFEGNGVISDSSDRDAHGGAVFMESTYGNVNFTLNSVNSKFINNSALAKERWGDGCGGAIYLYSEYGYVDIDLNCNYTVFANNTVSMGSDGDSQGGAIYVYGCYDEVYVDLDFVNSSFDGNRALNPTNDAYNWQGGAIYIWLDCPIKISLNCENSSFTNNSAGIGGAIYMYNDDEKTDFIINGPNAVFDNNRAEGSGAFLHLESNYGLVNLTVNGDDMLFSNNTVHEDGYYCGGGALYVSSSYKDVLVNIIGNNCTFINNAGLGQDLGGALYAYSQSGYVVSRISNVSFINNSAEIGGALYFSSGNDYLDVEKNKYVIVNCTFEDNYATGYGDGGAFHIGGYYFNCEITDTTFNNNSAPSAGGCYFSIYESTNMEGVVRNITFENVTFKNNTAFYSGGAVYVTSSDYDVDLVSVNFKDVDFIGNSAENGAGGAVHCADYIDVYLNCDECDFINNSGSMGGAISVSGYYLDSNITNVNFIGNTVKGQSYDGEGGAIYVYVSGHQYVNGTPSPTKLMITNVTFENNLGIGEYASGGAIFFKSGGEYEFNLTNVEFTNNSAADGGAIYLPVSLSGIYVDDNYYVTASPRDFVNFNNATFKNNTANSRGGSIYVIYSYGDEKGGSLNMNFKDSTLTDNDADYGGAIYAYLGSDSYGPSNFTINCTNTSIENNSANSCGGAIGYYLSGYHIAYNNVTLLNDKPFVNNSAENGGAVYVMFDPYYGSYGLVNNLTFKDLTFINNTADNGGAAYVFFKSMGSQSYRKDDLNNVHFDNDVFKNNTANKNGGAIYIDAGNSPNLVLNCTNDEFIGNNASEKGGAIYAVKSNVSVSNSAMNNNSASSGGAIEYDGNSLSVSDSTLLDNKVDSSDIELNFDKNVFNVALIGNQNYLNAISSTSSPQFSNIEYWNGVKVNTDTDDDDSLNNESHQIIDLKIYRGSRLVDSTTLLTSSSGTASYDFTGLPDGTYTFVASHPDSGYYGPISKSGTFVMRNPSVDINLTVKVNNVEYGQNATVEIFMKDNAGNNLTGMKVNLTVDSVTYEVNVTDGYASKIISGLPVGDNYLVNVTSAENGSYNAAEATVFFNVTKIRSTLDVNDMQIAYGGSNTTLVNYTGAKNVTANVINHTEVIVTVGNKNITVSNLAVGTYTLNVTTVPLNDNYTAVSKNVTITVLKAGSLVVIESIINGTYNQTSADVRISVENYTEVSYIVKAENGAVVIANTTFAYVPGIEEVIRISNLAAGNYIIVVANAEGQNYTYSSSEGKFKISKANLTVAVVGENVTNWDNAKINVTSIPSDFNGNVSVVVDGVTVYNGTLTNSIDIGAFAVGQKTAHVTFYGDDNYADKTVDANFTVSLYIINGTYTDLQNKIDNAVGGVFDLPYDFAYLPGYDDVNNPNFINGVMLNKTLTINGNGHTISGNGSARIFNVTGNATLNDITFVNGNAADGAAIYLRGNDIKITNSRFRDNSASNRGGAIFVDVDGNSRELLLAIGSDVIFENNTALNGGAIFIDASSNAGKVVLNVTHGTIFKNNTAGLNGGALFIQANNDIAPTCYSTLFANNTAGDSGGAIFVNATGNGYNEFRWDIRNPAFENNTAGLNGGAIALHGVDMGEMLLMLENGHLYNNTAGADGGAIYYNSTGDSKLSLYNEVKFMDNRAFRGGALSLRNIGGTYFFASMLKNKANSTNITYVYENDNLTFTFSANENYLNAIYAENWNPAYIGDLYYWNGAVANAGITGAFNSENESGINLTLEIEGISQPIRLVTDEFGKANFSTLGLPAGVYNFTVYHEDDDYYTSVRTTGQFTVISDTNLTVSVDDITYGQNATVNVRLTDADGNNLTGVIVNVTIDGQTYEIPITNGFGSRDISGLAAKDNYTVNATFKGEGVYNPSNATDNFTVLRANSTVYIKADNVTYGAVVNVNITVENATNVNYTLKYADGTVIEQDVPVDLTKILTLDLGVGNYTITVVNGDTLNIAGSQASRNFTVRKANSTVNASDLVLAYGIAPVVTVSSVNASSVIVTVLDKDNNTVYSNASALANGDVVLPILEVGNYTVKLATNPLNGNYSVGVNEYKLTIVKANSSVVISEVGNVTYPDSVVINFTVSNASDVNWTIVNKDTGDKITGGGLNNITQALAAGG